MLRRVTVFHDLLDLHLRIELPKECSGNVEPRHDDRLTAIHLGGAQNHRMGLWDAAMIKDNHVLVAGGVGQAIGSVRAAGIERIICEVDRLDQIEPAIAAGATHLLLDNMPPATLREAVALVSARAATEASGGVTLDTIGEIAATGVDFVSVGRITQSAPAADIGLDFTQA